MKKSVSLKYLSSVIYRPKSKPYIVLISFFSTFLLFKQKCDSICYALAFFYVDKREIFIGNC